MLLPGIDDDVLLSPTETAVSLYLAIDPESSDARAHAERLGALFSAAEEALRMRGASRRACDALLSPGRDAAAGLDLRNHRPPAIGVFCGAGFGRLVELPIPVDTDVAVGHRFLVRPLLPLINSGSFMVLALNAARGRLLECDTNGSWVDRTPDMLRHLPDVAEETDFQPTSAGSPAARHRKAASGSVVGSHSYEDPEAVRKVELIEELRRVSSTVEDALKDDHRPVILVADPSTGGQFRKLTGLRQLVAEGASLNPNGLSNDKLVACARAVYRSPEAAARAELAERISARAHSGDGPVATRLNEVVSAAHYGRIDAVLVAEHVSVWGHFDEANDRLTVHNHPQPEDDELLNEIVAETLRKGGRAFIAQRQELPPQSLAAATLRY